MHRDNLKRDIRALTAKFNFLFNQKKEFLENRKLRDQLMISKGVIETTVKQVLDENILARNIVDLNKLKKEIEIINKRIAKYGLKEKYEKANIFLKNEMNSICEKLDFEEELKPSDLNFDLKNFEFFHLKNKDKIYLSEMGSGANWLACHLSLFLGILKLACKEKKSSIPNFLFLDQPSQVYFPKSFSKDEFESDGNQEISTMKILNK